MGAPPLPILRSSSSVPAGGRAPPFGPNGNILAAGYGSRSTADLAIIRLDPSGVPDATFGTNGQALIDVAGGDDRFFRLAVQPDGRVVAAGQAYNGASKDFVVARFLAN